MKNLGVIIAYTFAVVLITCLATGLVILAWQNRGGDDEVVKITNDVVIERVTEQAFLVTRTVYTDQNVAIEVDQGSDWSNFWWGKTIVASGRVRTDVGVDFSGLNRSDIEVDEDAKTITISNIDPDILDSSIDSSLEVEDEGSILRRVLTDKSDEDYQTASQELIAAAERNVEDNPDLDGEVVSAAEEFLSALFQESDYDVVIEVSEQ